MPAMPHMELDGLRVADVGRARSRGGVDEPSKPQLEHQQLPDAMPMIRASVAVFGPHPRNLVVVEDPAIAQAAVAKQRVRHWSERAPEPLSDRRLEAAFTAFEDRARHLTLERLAEEVFRPAVFQLQRAGYGGGELEEPMVQQRLARLQRHGHAHAIDLREIVVDHVIVYFVIDGSVERIRGTAPPIRVPE